jgi:hypothetical protein
MKEYKTVRVEDLKSGDYVIPANAVVKEVDWFSCLVIIDFADNTSTPPIPAGTLVEVKT